MSNLVEKAKRILNQKNLMPNGKIVMVDTRELCQAVGIRLFGTASDEGISFDWTVGVNKEDTHTALLIGIEEIEK